MMKDDMDQHEVNGLPPLLVHHHHLGESYLYVEKADHLPKRLLGALLSEIRAWQPRMASIRSILVISLCPDNPRKVCLPGYDAE